PAFPGPRKGNALPGSTPQRPTPPCPGPRARDNARHTPATGTSVRRWTSATAKTGTRRHSPDPGLFSPAGSDSVPADESAGHRRGNAPGRTVVTHAVPEGLSEVLEAIDRRGSPYTLVCTKNDALYRARLKKFTEDEEHLATLRAVQASLPK